MVHNIFKNRLLFIVLSLFLIAFLSVLAYYIVCNAQWLIGDDAIVIRHTGWGHGFSMKDTIIPSNGRFFPLAYMSYNILDIFNLTSAASHFYFMAIVFVMMSGVALILAYVSIDKFAKPVWRYLGIISFLAICVSRSYQNFLDTYSTVWFDYFLILLWCLCSYCVHHNKSKIAALIGFIVVTYACYCLETIFIFPLSYGICGLLFNRRHISKTEVAYLVSLVCSALLFLILYYFICYVHIDQAYDGAHGQDIGILGNATRMFIAQKVLWLGLAVFCYRIFLIFRKREQFEFWDTIILAGFSFCCGCAILRLNWTLYYSLASIFILPAVVHYIYKIIGERWSALMLIALSLFMCRNIPNSITDNQTARKTTANTMSVIESYYDMGDSFFWVEPTDDREWNFDLELRLWLRECIQTLIGHKIHKEDYEMQVVGDFDCSPGVYFLPKQNDVLFPGVNKIIQESGEKIIGTSQSDIIIVRIR